MMSALTELLEVINLTKIGPNLYQGKCLNLGLRQVYGGQIFAQSLNAAMQIVELSKIAHSCHTFFIAPGDSQFHIKYQPKTMREGRNFVTIEVDAIQKDTLLSRTTVSFHNDEVGYNHQASFPEILPFHEYKDEQSWLKQRQDKIPAHLQALFTKESPFYCYSRYLNHPFAGEIHPPKQQSWLKLKEKISSDVRLQQCLLAYISDYPNPLTALHPHARGFLQDGMKVATIDHHIWFHRTPNVCDWFLYDLESNNAHAGLGLTRGQIFSNNKELLASTQQESLIRDQNYKLDNI